MAQFLAPRILINLTEAVLQRGKTREVTLSANTKYNLNISQCLTTLQGKKLHIHYVKLRLDRICLLWVPKKAKACQTEGSKTSMIHLVHLVLTFRCASRYTILS